MKLWPLEDVYISGVRLPGKGGEMKMPLMPLNWWHTELQKGAKRSFGWSKRQSRKNPGKISAMISEDWVVRWWCVSLVHMSSQPSFDCKRDKDVINTLFPTHLATGKRTGCFPILPEETSLFAEEELIWEVKLLQNKKHLDLMVCLQKS